MQVQKMKSQSAKKYSEWQVRGIAAVGAHVSAGGTAQLFEFRPKGEHASYVYVFLGIGYGVGAKGGAGGTNFVTPHEFAWDTAKLVGSAFWEVGRQMAGGAPRRDTTKYYEGLMSFSDIAVTTPFSALDLDRAYGELAEASASLAMGYGCSFISAETQNAVLFTHQSTAGDGAFGQGVVGGTTGVSLGGSANTGRWFMI